MKEGRTAHSFAVETLWKNGERGEAWHLLGWGNFFRGRTAPGDDGPYFEGDSVTLRIESPIRFGSAGAFISPDKIRLLTPGVSVDSILKPNIREGIVEEILPLGSFARLPIQTGQILWQAEISPDLLESLSVQIGANVHFSILPSDVEVAAKEGEE